MRDIKFRAWDKAFRKMFKVISVGYEGKETLAWRFPFEDERVGWSSAGWEVGKECDLMQYTGLKDKNGKEIYEGDVLTSHEYPFQDDGVYNYHGVVEWADEAAAFVITKRVVNPKRRGISDGIAEYMEEMDSFEVIGNIYENAELVK